MNISWLKFQGQLAIRPPQKLPQSTSIRTSLVNKQSGKFWKLGFRRDLVKNLIPRREASV